MTPVPSGEVREKRGEERLVDATPEPFLTLLPPTRIAYDGDEVVRQR
jgi:hypothetical protein